MSSNNFHPFVEDIVRQFGIQKGCSNSEKVTNYKSVLDIPNLPSDQRFIVCTGGIQVIHQEFYGERWRPLAFYASQSGLNRGLSAASVSDESIHVVGTNSSQAKTELEQIQQDISVEVA